MEWRPLPESTTLCSPVQWVGRDGGEDVAWIIEWRHWGDGGHRWMVATPHGTAFGLRPTLEEAQRSVESVLRVYNTAAAK
jgi:hypothetical protein